MGFQDCPICEARGHVRLASEDRYICSSCCGSATGSNGDPCHVCYGIGRLDANRQPIKIDRWNVKAPVPTVIPGLAEAVQRALQAPPLSPKQLPPPPPAHTQLIAPSRIDELRVCAPERLDFKKLIRLCEEINICAEKECWYAVATLTRAILDHVPPAFGFAKFAEVAANYVGTKSFKETMHHLDEASRKIADAHLHERMRASEVLPTWQQVNCGQELDVLFGEIVRIVPRAPTSTSAGGI